MGPRIRQMEVNNFKSYNGDFIIGPFSDFTAVIGPNGAGKSNCMDAISFVLGVNTSNLRGSKITDLIFRPEGEDPSDQTRTATVTLVIDEPDGVECRLSRSVSCEGHSEYRINGKSSSHKAFDKHLKEYGILVKARNFLVFQGDVEAVAQKKPKELTALLEIISGSGDLKEEYDQLKQAKLEADETLIVASGKTKNIRAEKKVAKEQKKEMERFNEILAQEAELKTNHMLWKLYQVESEITVGVEELAQLAEHAEEASEEVQEAESNVQAKIQERAKFQREEKQHQKKIEQQKKAIETLAPKRIELEEKMAHTEKRQKSAESSLKKLKKSADKQGEVASKIDADLMQLKAAYAEFEEQAAQEQGSKGLKLGVKQQSEYNKLKEQAGLETHALKAELKRSEQSRDRMQKDFDSKSMNCKQLLKMKQELQEKVAALNDKQQTREQDLIDCRQEGEDVGKELKTLDTDDGASKDREAKLQERLGKVDQLLQNYKADKHENRKDNQQRQALETLKRLYPGVHGRLFDLCSIVDRKYNVAVTITLGKNMDAIVVDDDKTAIECIDYLKAQRMGRMTFVPLEIRAKPVNETVRGMCAQNANRSLIIDVITYEKKYENVLCYACGDTVVCPDLQDGRNFSFGGKQRYKAVTLDGVLISKNGNMSGGNSGETNRSNRWDQKEVDTLKSKRDTWRKELNEIRHFKISVERQSELKNQLLTLDNKIQMIEKEKKKDAAKIVEHEKNIKAHTKEVKKLSPELEKSGSTLKEQDQVVQEVESRIGCCEEKIFHEFSDKVGVRNIREYEENILIDLKQHGEKKLQFQKNIGRLENQAKLERTRDKSQELTKLEAQVKDYATMLSESADKHEEYREKTAQLESGLEELVSAAERQSADVKAFDVELKELRKLLDAERNKLGGHQKKVDAKEAIIDHLRVQRHTLFQQTRLQEIALPMHREAAGKAASSRRASVPEGSSKRRRTSNGHKSTGEQLEMTEPFLEHDGHTDVSKATAENVAIQIDLSSVPDNRRRAYTQEEAEQEADRHRDRLKSFILEMEKISPNTRALEKYAEAEGRMKNIVDEFETAKNESNEAMQAFDAVKAKRYELFTAAFKHVAGCIDDIYKELTVSAKCPAGGTAVLTLENEEEPYLHGVRYYPQPPFKGFRDIDQLSGGEKSISALALLFSIHSFKPAPFFVLDEVDAALDTANVAHVAQYIRTKKEQTQFVVISLKDHFYENADGLVGICKNRESQSSAVFTMDLQPFQASD